MDDSLAQMRRDYEMRGLSRADVLADPLQQFTLWFDEACGAPVQEPNAMTLARGTKKLFKQDLSREWRDHIEAVAKRLTKRVRSP